ncbi:MAG: tetratricopeptide repeat protein [Bacteroidota bacterium]
MRKYLYLILVAITGLFFVLILIFAKKTEASIPSFKERSGSIALTGEWLNTKQVIKSLLTALEANPNDTKSKLKLAQAYIEEARITGDHGYYDNASLELLDDVLETEPSNFDALCCKATVLLSQHHFSDGLAIAQQALPLNTNSAFIYGLMCDANVELGQYDQAIKMADKMVSVRPDMRSYSRISYLREIYGDYKGAIEAAKMAVSAGYPGLEQTEFSRIILAHLYESTGALDSAANQYNTALYERPDYAFAIAGLGRIEKIKGNYKEAIAFYEKAKTMIIEYSFSDELTDLYQLANQPEKAQKSAQEVIDMLKPGSNEEESSTAHGHYADKELAYAYLKISDTENALKHAKLEYERRPLNIDICEAMAWVNYKRKDYKEANKYINTALKTKSNNPVLLCRAGLIKIKAGEQKAGEEMIRKAFEINPFIADIAVKNEASSYLTGNTKGV